MVQRGAEVMTVMTIEAELRVPAATAQLVQFTISEPADNVLRADEAYWLDLCLTPRPRNARACYRDHWAPDHFERIGEIFMVPPGESMRAKSDGGRPQSPSCAISAGMPCAPGSAAICNGRTGD